MEEAFAKRDIFGNKYTKMRKLYQTSCNVAAIFESTFFRGNASDDPGPRTNRDDL